MFPLSVSFQSLLFNILVYKLTTLFSLSLLPPLSLLLTQVTAVGFVPDSSCVVMTSGTSLFKYDLRRSDVVLREPDTAWMDMATEECNSLACHEKGSYVAVGDDAGVVQVVDLSLSPPLSSSFSGTSKGDVYWESKQPHDNICSSVSFASRRPTEVLSGGMDCHIFATDFKTNKRRINLSTGVTFEENVQSMCPPFVHAIDVHASGKLLAAGLGDGSVLLVDVQGGKAVDRYIGHMSMACSVYVFYLLLSLSLSLSLLSLSISLSLFFCARFCLVFPPLFLTLSLSPPTTHTTASSSLALHAIF